MTSTKVEEALQGKVMIREKGVRRAEKGGNESGRRNVRKKENTTRKMEAKREQHKRVAEEGNDVTIARG